MGIEDLSVRHDQAYAPSLLILTLSDLTIGKETRNDNTETSIMNEHHVTMNSLVSIIVPIYNVQDRLDRCVESLVGQTYRNLQILLVNDGSPDDCPKLCDEWASKDGRINVIHKPNGGLSSARNAGLEVASGDCIAFVDSDDYVEPDYVQTMLEAMVQHEADMVVSSVFVESAQGEPLQDYGRYALTDGGDEQELTARECMELGINKLMYVVAWNKLYRRSIWEDLRYPEGKLHEDEFVFHRVVGGCNRIVALRKKLYHYVQNDHSIMGSKYTVRNLDRLEAWLNRIEYLDAHDMSQLIPPMVRWMVWDCNNAARFLDFHDAKVRQRFLELAGRLRGMLGACVHSGGKKQRLLCTAYACCPMLAVRLHKLMTR